MLLHVSLLFVTFARVSDAFEVDDILENLGLQVPVIIQPSGGFQLHDALFEPSHRVEFFNEMQQKNGMHFTG